MWAINCAIGLVVVGMVMEQCGLTVFATGVVKIHICEFLTSACYVFGARNQTICSLNIPLEMLRMGFMIRWHVHVEMCVKCLKSRFTRPVKNVLRAGAHPVNVWYMWPHLHGIMSWYQVMIYVPNFVELEQIMKFWGGVWNWDVEKNWVLGHFWSVCVCSLEPWFKCKVLDMYPSTWVMFVWWL